MIDPEGKFLDPAPKESRVGIKISKETAMCREGQLLLWMTCNLICRLKGMIGEVEICVPPDIQISMPRYMPFEFSHMNLKASLSDVLGNCARNCNIVFSRDDLQSDLDAVILVGSNTATHAKTEFTKNVACDGWLAYIGDGRVLCNLPHSDSNNPFGAFAAACIVVGEVFKFAGKIKPDMADMIDSLCFSVYDLKCHLKSWEYVENPPMDRQVDLGCLHVCGAGAVAHAFSQALFPIEGLNGNLFFIDRSRTTNCADETIEPTNLARYIMAANRDVGMSKAELLANKMSTTGIQVGFSDEGLEAYVNLNAGQFSHTISCVDNNHARHVIQDQIPKMIHGGSTVDLRSQVSIYDLSCDDCQCMKCSNSIEDGASDNEIQERLTNMSAERRKTIAVENNTNPEKLEQYLRNPECGTLGNESIQKFAGLDNRPEFSVNFVSALTGILLAAEIVKTKSKSLKPVLDGNQKTDLYYRFWTNTCQIVPSRPEISCWCNKGATTTPRDIHKHTWLRSRDYT